MLGVNLRFPALLAALPVFGLLLGYGVSPSLDGQRTLVPQATWKLELKTGMSSYVPADFQELRQWPLLHAAKEGADTQESAAKAKWSVLALISKPEPVAVVAVEGQSSLLRVKPGEPLPDDGKLSSVFADHLVADYGGCQRNYVLYATGSAETKTCPAVAEQPIRNQ